MSPRKTKKRKAREWWVTVHDPKCSLAPLDIDIERKNADAEIKDWCSLTTSGCRVVRVREVLPGKKVKNA